MSESTNVKAIRDVWPRVFSPTGLPFPKTVSTLLALGVTRYHMDYVALTVTSYISTTPATVDVASIPSHIESGDAAATTNPEWNEDRLISAIQRARDGDGNYHEFARDCIHAGVTGYFAFLTGKRVVYFGANGDIYVDWFPGAGPREERK